PPSKSTRPSSPPSTSPTDATASTNCATTCAGSGATDYCSVTDPDTLIVSPQKASRSPCSSSSSTNGSAAHSPTAASTTAPPPAISRPAGWKPPITAPTQPSNASSICLLPDVHLASAILGLFLSTIRRGRIEVESREASNRGGPHDILRPRERVVPGGRVEDRFGCAPWVALRASPAT